MIEGETLYESTGIIRYFNDPNADPFRCKMIVEVDPEIVRFYRSLIPKSIRTNKQMYDPHISVIRKERDFKRELWGKYEGQEVVFQYSNIVRWGTVYYWLDAYSETLRQIRLELGLQPTTALNRPPDGKECYHITLGNIKGLGAAGTIG